MKIDAIESLIEAQQKKGIHNTLAVHRVKYGGAKWIAFLAAQGYAGSIMGFGETAEQAILDIESKVGLYDLEQYQLPEEARDIVPEHKEKFFVVEKDRALGIEFKDEELFELGRDFETYAEAEAAVFAHVSGAGLGFEDGERDPEQDLRGAKMWKNMRLIIRKKTETDVAEYRDDMRTVIRLDGKVELLATGYSWTCPICGESNRNMIRSTAVQCRFCFSELIVAGVLDYEIDEGDEDERN